MGKQWERLEEPNDSRTVERKASAGKPGLCKAWWTLCGNQGADSWALCKPFNAIPCHHGHRNVGMCAQIRGAGSDLDRKQPQYPPLPAKCVNVCKRQARSTPSFLNSTDSAGRALVSTVSAHPKGSRETLRRMLCTSQR
jgi:hypothetical protein